MKILIKILLCLLAVAGVCYWLLGKCAAPAERLWAWRRVYRSPDSEELTKPDTDDEPQA